MEIISHEAARISVIACGLIVNLIFNLIIYKEIFTKENICYYSLILICTGTALMLANLSIVGEELILLFYGVVGYSVPQIGIYLMATTYFKRISTKIMEFVEITDFPEYTKDIIRDKQPDVIRAKAKQKAKFYIQKGIFNKNRADEYLSSVEYLIRIHNTSRSVK